MPVIFTGEEKLTGWGGSGGAEFGIDMNGWLFGLQYHFLGYAQSKKEDYLMQSFHHNTIGLNISKSFSQGLVGFLPEWLELRLKLGIAIDLMKADYYASIEAKEADILYTSSDRALMYTAGIYADFTGVPFVTPILGADFAFAVDRGGLFVMPLITLGARLTIGNLL